MFCYKKKSLSLRNTAYADSNRQNLLQLLWLRTIAIFGQIATIFFAVFILHIELPINAMFGVVAFLALVNVVSFYRYKNHLSLRDNIHAPRGAPRFAGTPTRMSLGHTRKDITDKSLFFELLIDVVALTLQLYLSGGVANPFISLFLLQVIIAAVLLEAFFAWILAAITIFCYINLGFFYRELHAFHHHDQDSFFNLHLQGMLIAYVLAAILLLVFISKINKNLKEREEKINLLKQQSLQKEQIMRMGLLATSAAHELGTPLSTIAVITSDWKRMKLKKELKNDVNLLEEQIKRCKKIISEILSSSEKSRLEAAKVILVKKFFDKIIKEWKNSRQPQNFIYKFNYKGGKKIIADEILAQAFFNIFDNALEASPLFVKVEAEVVDEEFIVKITDQGNGFDKKILEKIGEKNLSTKNSSGVGLFLAVNILQMRQGSLEIKNLEDGAQVLIKIRL